MAEFRELTPEEAREGEATKFRVLEEEEQVSLARPAEPKRSVEDLSFRERFLPSSVLGLIPLPGGLDQADLRPGEGNIFFDIFERGGAANRAAIKAAFKGENVNEAYVQGALTPEEVTRFQENFLDKYSNIAGRLESGLASIDNALLNNAVTRKLLNTATEAVGLGPSGAGLVLDIITNPADMLLLMSGKIPLGKGRTVGSVVANSKLGKFLTKQRQIVKNTSKANKAYAQNKVVPEGVKAYNKQALKFDPKFAEHAAEQGMSQGAIKTMQTKGVQNTYNKARLAGTTDDVAVQINKNIAQQAANADKLYGEAIAKVPKEKVWNTKKTQAVVGEELRLRGLVNKDGSLRIPQEGLIEPADRALIKFSQDLTQVTNIDQFNTTTSRIGRQFSADAGSNRLWAKIHDAHYADATSSIKGIQSARAAQKTKFEVKGRWSTKEGAPKDDIRKSGLDKWQSEKKNDTFLQRDYAKLEKDINFKFADNVDAVTASAELNLVHDKSGAYISKNLQAIVDNPKMVDVVKKDVGRTLGNKSTNIFADLASHRKVLQVTQFAKRAGQIAALGGIIGGLSKARRSVIETDSGGGGGN